MEHIIQFGVNIDEDKIVNTATGMAANEIVKKVQKEIDSYRRGYEDGILGNIFREEIKKVVEENKDRIIADATKQLAANMARTKAVKDMIAKLEAGE